MADVVYRVRADWPETDPPLGMAEVEKRTAKFVYIKGGYQLRSFGYRVQLLRTEVFDTPEQAVESALAEIDIKIGEMTNMLNRWREMRGQVANLAGKGERQWQMK